MPEMLADPDVMLSVGPYLPARHNPNIPGPWLLPNLVPQPLWGRNLRALLAPKQWDRLRTDVYDSCGNRCTICGMTGRKWPVEADEVWHYDDATNTQYLVSVVGLCPACHEVRHWGRSVARGHSARALSHLAGVNRWSMIQAREEVDRALALWRQRNEREWTSDYYKMASGWFGYWIEDDGYDRADEANRRLIAEARALAAGAANARP